MFARRSAERIIVSEPCGKHNRLADCLSLSLELPLDLLYLPGP